MDGKKHITAFYLETLLMIVVFISIIVVLSGIFGISGVESVRARELNDAVCLAENAAEAFSAARSPDDLAGLLSGEVKDGEVVVFYDKERVPAENGFYRLTATWEPDGTEGLYKGTISVYGDDLIYSLDTAVFCGE